MYFTFIKATLLGTLVQSNPLQLLWSLQCLSFCWHSLRGHNSTTTTITSWINGRVVVVLDHIGLYKCAEAFIGSIPAIDWDCQPVIWSIHTKRCLNVIQHYIFTPELLHRVRNTQNLRDYRFDVLVFTLFECLCSTFH